MTPRPIRLYDYLFSGNGYKIRLALAQLELDVEIQLLDILAGETRTSTFLQKNPMGQIPVLELENGMFLRESNAILYWLTTGTWLLPEDRSDRALVLQWMFFEQSNVDKIIGRARFLKANPNFRKVSREDWDYWHTTGNKALAVMENTLKDRPFLLGNDYSAADIALYGYVHCADEGGFTLSDYPSVCRWIENVSRQPRHITIDFKSA